MLCLSRTNTSPDSFDANQYRNVQTFESSQIRRNPGCRLCTALVKIVKKSRKQGEILSLSMANEVVFDEIADRPTHSFACIIITILSSSFSLYQGCGAACNFFTASYAILLHPPLSLDFFFQSPSSPAFFTSLFEDEEQNGNRMLEYFKRGAR